MQTGESLAVRLRGELRTVVVVGIPATVYVFATNVTATPGLIVLHVALLAALVPLFVTATAYVATRLFGAPNVAAPSTNGAVAQAASVAWNVAVRLVGLALAVVPMLAGLHLVTGESFTRLASPALTVALVPVFLGYALVSLVSDWAGLRAHALRLVAREASARQAALTARIRPHFLFNALNCIEELTDTDPPAARVAVGRLARLLRAVLAASEASVSELASEARLVEDYFGIEQIRFGSRFAYSVDVPAELARAPIPPTVLLTLAENAVKHGVEKTAGNVTVHLRVARDAGAVVVTMVSPARKLDARHGDPARDARLGDGRYGLADIRERLALAYGDRAHATLRDTDEGTHVELRFPSTA